MEIRTKLRPGDLGYIVYLHGILYAAERGFDSTFEAYVAGPLAEFVKAASARERLWIAEQDGRIVGCVAVVAAGAKTAQLRGSWSIRAFEVSGWKVPTCGSDFLLRSVRIQNRYALDGERVDGGGSSLSRGGVSQGGRETGPHVGKDVVEERDKLGSWG